MDDSRFDDVIRTLAQHPSRRGLLAGLMAGVAALAGLAPRAEARVHRQQGPDPCVVRCVDEPRARGANCRLVCRSCPTGPAGTCFDDQTKGFYCADLDTDENNCGTCGTVCNPTTQTCLAGTCCGLRGKPGACMDGPCCGTDVCDFSQATCVACTEAGQFCNPGFGSTCCQGLQCSLATSTCEPIGT
jgi:hypothetical protein